MVLGLLSYGDPRSQRVRNVPESTTPTSGQVVVAIDEHSRITNPSHSELQKALSAQTFGRKSRLCGSAEAARPFIDDAQAMRALNRIVETGTKRCKRHSLKTRFSRVSYAPPENLVNWFL